MSPPTPKEWWLAAALTGAAVPAAIGQQAPQAAPAPRTPIGQATTSTPTGLQTTPIYIDAATSNRPLVNNTTQPMHVLFSDQSAVTLAPGAEMTIRDYRFDSEKREGNIVLGLARGLLRVVGGQISKRTATRVVTPTATIGVRGGITLVELGGPGSGPAGGAAPGPTQAAFLFGSALTVETPNGPPSTFEVPGTVVGINGNAFTSTRIAPGDLARMQLALGNGVPPTPPGGAGTGTPPAVASAVRNNRTPLAPTGVENTAERKAPGITAATAPPPNLGPNFFTVGTNPGTASLQYATGHDHHYHSGS